MTSNYNSINTPLFRRVPANARRILDVGCDTGLLGAALKERNSAAYVVGIEMSPESAREAKSRLDEVYVLNIESDDLTNLGGDFDAIIFGDVLEHLYDPEASLRTLRHLLSATGQVYACIPNMQHYTIFRTLLRGDFQYQRLGLLDRTHIRFYTLANIMKLFLDGGYIPKKTGRLANEPNRISELLAGVVNELGYNELNVSNINTFQFLFKASPMRVADSDTQASPITFVICSNDPDILASNILASPIFHKRKHQIIVKRGMRSAADGYNQGFAEAKNETVVFVHQEMYLPEGWDSRLTAQLAAINLSKADSWVLGCVGASATTEGDRKLSGVVIDQDQTLDYTSSIEPVEVQTLEDMLLVLPAKSKLRFDPQLGYDYYAADICLQNSALGGKNFAGYIPCFHNSRLNDPDSSPDFDDSKQRFQGKWRDVPNVMTTCAGLRQK